MYQYDKLTEELCQGDKALMLNSTCAILLNQNLALFSVESTSLALLPRRNLQLGEDVDEQGL